MGRGPLPMTKVGAPRDDHKPQQLATLVTAARRPCQRCTPFFSSVEGGEPPVELPALLTKETLEAPHWWDHDAQLAAGARQALEESLRDVLTDGYSFIKFNVFAAGLAHHRAQELRALNVQIGSHDGSHGFEGRRKNRTT